MDGLTPGRALDLGSGEGPLVSPFYGQCTLSTDWIDRDRSRSIATGLGLALAMSACGSGGGDPGDPTSAAPSVLVTDDATVSRTHEASFLLIDGDDPETVYLSESELQSGDCRLYMSTNQGGTWSAVEETVDSPVETGKGPGADQSPEVAPHTDCTLGSGSQNIRTELKQAPDGPLYYLFSGNHVDPAVRSRTVLLSRSTDGGSSWETTIVDDGGESAPGEVEVNFQAPHGHRSGRPRADLRHVAPLPGRGAASTTHPAAHGRL